MSLSGALSVAAAGLANINRQLLVVSQNVSNAGTPGYAREVSTPSDVTADGIEIGVRSGIVGRSVDVGAQGLVLTQNAAVSGLQTRQAALATIDALQGTPGQGADLASLTGRLQDAFSTLATDPSSPAQQLAVVAAAQGLAQQVNAISAGVTAARQAAQDGLVGGVAALNAGLHDIGQLSNQIIRLQAAGQSTADLENQRDAATTGLSQLLDLKFLQQPNGDLLAVTTSGLDLPLHGATAPFQLGSATIGSTASYAAGTVPAITLNGSDVTGQVSGGRLGADVVLRDGTLPAYQGGLDEFAARLSQRFAQQGLVLFTDRAGGVPLPTGTVPQGGYIGFAGTLAVNPAVVADAALVRDGNVAIGGSAASSSAFTPNPAGGPAGFTGLLSRVLSFAFGGEIQPGVAQPPMLTSGLGSTGTLALGFTAPATLGGFAAALVAAQAADSGDAAAALSRQTGVQTALQARAASVSAVSIDQEMSSMVQLQNAYGANARVISAVQAMWTQLLQMVA